MDDRLAIQKALNQLGDNGMTPDTSTKVTEAPKQEETVPEATEAPKETVVEVENEKPVEQAKPKNSFAKLLSERNAARREAEEKDQLIAEKNAELDAVKEKLKELQGKEVPEEEARSHDMDIIDTIAKKNALETDLNNSKKSLDKQFYKDIPEAMDIKDKIDAIQKKHPTMNPYEAFAFYVGNLGEVAQAQVEKPDEQKENQKKDYDLLGSPTAGTVKSDKSGMSTAEMKESLRASILNGDLAL